MHYHNTSIDYLSVISMLPCVCSVIDHDDVKKVAYEALGISSYDKKTKFW